MKARERWQTYSKAWEKSKEMREIQELLMRRKDALWLHSFIDIGAEISTSLKGCVLALAVLRIFV